MLKRGFMVFLAVVVTAAGLFAGGGADSKGGGAPGAGSSASQTPLTVWMKKQFVEDQNTFFEDRVRAFAKSKNVPVVIEFIAYEDFYTKWTAAISSGNVPDITFFTIGEVGEFYQRGVLEDITQTVNEIQAKYGPIVKSQLDAVTFNGQLYALPFWGEGTVLYYRKDMLKAAGYDRPPDTWEEFREIAKKCTDPSKNQFGAGIGYGSGNSDAEWLSRSMLWSFGGKIFDKNGKIALDSPETRKFIQFVTDIFLVDKSTPPSAIGWNDAGNNTAYLSGQAAMIVNTGSVANSMKTNDPDLYAKTGLVALPRGPAGRFIVGLSNNLSIFKGAKNKELAKELLVNLTDTSWYQKWIDVGAPLTTPVFAKLAETDPIWQDPYNKALLDSQNYFKFLGYEGPITPNAGKIANLRLMNVMFEDIIANKVPMETALQNFITEANKVIQQ